MKHLNTWLLAAVTLLCWVALTGFRPENAQNCLKNIENAPAEDLLGGPDTTHIWLPNCAAGAKFCLPITPGQAIGLSITDNGAPLSVGLSNGCDFDTTSAYTYSTLFGVGNFGPYYLMSWPVSGKIFRDTFNTIPELVDSMNGWDPLGHWMLDAAHMLITGGNSAQAYDTMKVWVININTLSHIGYNLGITPRGTEISLDRGFHNVLIHNANGTLRDSFCVRVACSQRVERDIEIGQMGTYCLELDDLLTGAASAKICSASGSAVEFSMATGSGACVNFTGKSAGIAEACLVAYDSTGFADTTFLSVRAQAQGHTYFQSVEIRAGESGSICPETMDLTGPVASAALCATVDFDGFAEFAMDVETGCVFYTGLMTGGADTICVAVCDDAGICDTTVLAVKVRRFEPAWVFDTMYLNQAVRVCVDKTNLTGTAQTLQIFDHPNPVMVFYNLDHANFCASLVGLKPGTDTMGLRLRYDNGQFDSTYIVLTILKPDTRTVFDTLAAGASHTFCLDTTQLAGSTFLLDNLCKNSTNPNVAFDANDLTLCLEMQAISPGTDTACITLCDNLGVCDTTILIITALDDPNALHPPTANPDNGLSEKSQPVVLSVLTNDVFIPPVVTLLVLPADGTFGPMHGITTADLAAGTITYTPDADFCNSTDNFRYILCNADGCDTALVSVLVMCDTTVVNPNLHTTVRDAFSPNGDNVNDTFTILNVEKFPDSVVRVYSRWGAEVFSKVGYQNDWTGIWKDKPLPDGVYFYYFNNGFDRIQQGPLLIKR